MNPVTLIIAGAGSRGTIYAEYASAHHDRAKVVGVGEPREEYLGRMTSAHNIKAKRTFRGWREMANQPRFADAVVISTQDSMHRDPVEAFAAKGYHILLEKPMASTETDCRAIAAAVSKSDAVFAVCHVMRYTAYSRKMKELLDEGAVGDIVSIQHLEPVGYWHQAHSFVRGNWSNERESSPMLLAKSCHDIDWLRYMVGRPCTRVASFGGLKHFQSGDKPKGAGDQCLCCDVEADCPYSAVKIYLGRVADGVTGWPVNILTPDVSDATVRDALATGPYGRCVYSCDNDVVDHQTVMLEFEGGITASFTMTAFCEAGHRRTRIFGTRGEINGDGVKIDLFNFLSDRHSCVDTSTGDAGILGGHGGGDYAVMDAFVTAVATGERSGILSGCEESLKSHLAVFAAEQARCTGQVVPVQV